MSGETAAEFQRRRQRAGRHMTPWVLLAVLGLSFTQWLAKDKEWYDIAMIAFAGCGFVGGLIGVSIFRCPNCETVPFDEDGIPLNPARCNKCGASLR